MPKAMRLEFLGGVGTVTGSKYLLDTGRRRILVDCGLFQGFKQLRLRNWDSLPIAPHDIDTVLLTHAHLDHSGYLPLLVRNGFKGTIHCTSATRDLCAILLPDSGRLQSQDADFANRHGFSKHHPALPLYDEADARAVLPRLAAAGFNQTIDLGDGVSASFRRAGHILGAASIVLARDGKKIMFSGDLGRPNDPVMLEPAPVPDVDHLVVESTYGDRRHERSDPAEVLAEIITRTTGRGGSVVIPAFAVGRAQTLLYYLHRLKAQRRIPDLPIFLDSPMAIDAGELYRRHREDHRLSVEEGREISATVRFTRSVEESKAIDRNHVPAVIVSASGMATGGRVLHHLKVFGPDERNTILFTGFQAPGTRGAAMVAGERRIKIHGAYIEIHAEVMNLGMLSAHADRDEILRWLKTAARPPETTFITHGDPAAADALRRQIEESLQWACSVPAYRDAVTLAV